MINPSFLFADFMEGGGGGVDELFDKLLLLVRPPVKINNRENKILTKNILLFLLCDKHGLIVEQGQNFHVGYKRS